MTPEQTLLVRTPRQHPFESPCGYVLRLSVCNGYVTPHTLLLLAGIDRMESFTVRLDQFRLGAVLGTNRKYLSAYTAPGETDVYRVELCGHPLTPGELDLKEVKICPDCIRELGYIPAWNDLAIIDGCPRHNRILLTLCPKCGRKLSWYRPGLLTCQCGQDLADAPVEPLDPSHAALLAYVVHKFTGEPVTKSSRMPDQELQALSLLGLLCFSHNLSVFARDAKSTAPWSQAHAASLLLKNWPQNLIRAMSERRHNTDATFSVKEQRDLRTNGVYRSMTARIPSSKDVAIVRNSVDAIPLESVLDAMAERKYVPRPEPEPSPLKTAVPVATTTRKNNRQPRSSVPSSRTLNRIAAAKLIGVPVAVLEYLRRTGHYEVKNKPSRALSYHEADVLAFRNKLLAVGEVPSTPTDKVLVRLAQAFLRKLKFADAKGELVAQMLTGELPTYGSQGPTVGDILLGQDEVAAFAARARTKVFAGKLTPTEVQRAIGVATVVVPALVASGHLVGTRHASGLRVTAESVEEFGRTYRPLSFVATARNTSSKWLFNLAESLGIEIFKVSRGPLTVTTQAFIKVVDIPRLV